MSSSILSMFVADNYVKGVLKKYAPASGPRVRFLVLGAIRPVIEDWAGSYLNAIIPAGSFAKGTAIKKGTDFDLFVSLKSNTEVTLKEVYLSLDQCLKNRGYVTRLQNVSIGITSKGFKVDIVPGIKRPFPSSDHSIYKRKADSWTQTNIQKHINYVKNSGCIAEIRATKIWRELNRLDFPSFYLEMSVINSLYRFPINNTSDNFLRVLQYLSSDFLNTRIVDPANTNNVVSDELNLAEKQKIATSAAGSLSHGDWSLILW